MSCPFSIHLVPQDVLARLKPAVRTDLADTLDALRRIHHAPQDRRRAVAREIELSHPGRRGWSDDSLLRKYYAVLNAGWRGAMDAARAGKTFWAVDDVTLPPGFIAFWQTLCESNQRSSARAYARLIQRWHSWRRGNAAAAIPGFTEPPAARPDTGLPEGWSERNLSRYSPTRRELTRARIGNAAATEQLMPVITTRAGLAVGQYYVIDDHEFDLKVNFVGQIKAMRPRMLGALDMRSGSLFSYGLKATLWDEVEERKRALTERDTKWLVVHILCNIGYRPQGTTFLTEHGLAVIRKPFAERISRVTNGAVSVERSGIHGKKQMPGQFDGKGGGNPRFKTHLESTWNLVDNTFADLPGQTGKDRDHSPEQLHGLERDNNALLKAAATLPPQLAGRLQFEVLTWHEFLQAALDRMAAIDTTRDHDLEGWEECGHITKFFRLTPDQPWAPISRLAHVPQEALATVLSVAETLPLRMSRREVFSAAREGLVRVPYAFVADLLGPEFGHPVTVRKMCLEIMDRDLGPSPFTYVARFGGHVLDEGTKVRCFMNPHDPEQLVTYDLDGRCIGIAEPLRRVCRTDTEAVEFQMGQRRSLETRVNARQDLRHAGFAAEHAERRRQNQEIIEGRAPATQAELEEQRHTQDLIDQHGATAAAAILSPTDTDPSPAVTPTDASAAAAAAAILSRDEDEDTYFTSGADERGGFLSSLI